MVTYKQAKAYVILDPNFKTDRVRSDGKNFIALYSIYDDDDNTRKDSEASVIKVLREEERKYGRKLKLLYRKTLSQ